MPLGSRRVNLGLVISLPVGVWVFPRPPAFGPLRLRTRWKDVKWSVLFDTCVQVLNSPTNIPTSTMSAFEVVDNMTEVEGW